VAFCPAVNFPRGILSGVICFVAFFPVVFCPVAFCPYTHFYRDGSSNNHVQGGPKKTGLFLRVDNFATVGGRKTCDMSKCSKFYLEKNLQLAYQCVKYPLPNLHKYSMSLKLR